MKRQLLRLVILISIVGSTMLGLMSSLPAQAQDPGTDLEAVRKAIQEKGANWIAGETSISKLPPEERSKLAGGALMEEVPPKTQQKVESLAVQQELPSHFDWRDVDGHNWMTGIKRQRCSDCWAFASIGAFEPLVRISLNDPDFNIDLSEQFVGSCSDGGCSAWRLSEALNFLQTTGTVTETCFPYVSSTPSCDQKCDAGESPIYRISDWHWVGRDVDSIKRQLLKGPVVARMQLYEDFLNFYNGRVYEHVSGKDLGGHFVTLIGWDDNEDCWIGKNSFGPDWGEDGGWFRIKRGEVGIEEYVAYLELSPIERGLIWLRTQREENGSWENSVSITALATLAFLNRAYYNPDLNMGTEYDREVHKGIEYILNYIQGDGSIYNWYPTYDTSIAILPLVATHNSDYNDEIANARAWLVGAQNDETFGYSSANYRYGGWTYGPYRGDPDLSNSQWALMGLDAAGLGKSDSTWAKAIQYTQRCQNRPASNDQPWAHNDTKLAYNDGGFLYRPWGWSLAGDTYSYGSMTAAGIWSLLLCGLDPTDGRVAAGLDWVANNYSWNYNPKTGGSWGDNALYYYYVSLAKALTMARKQTIGGHNWFEDLRNKLTSLQRDNGSWVGRTHYENRSELATSYALLALETRELPPGVPLSMSIILHSPADLHLYDAQGRHTGKNYETGGIDLEIPGSSYDPGDPQRIDVDPPMAGNYTIQLVGTEGGDYVLEIIGEQAGEVVSSDSYGGTIAPGQVQGSFLNVTAMEGALTIFSSPPESLPVMEVQPSSLTLSGAPGDTVEGAFTVMETGGDQGVQDISIFASDLTDGSGNTIPGTNVSFDPASFDLAAGGSQSVVMTVLIPGTLPDGSYSGSVTVESINAGAKSIQLIVEIISNLPPEVNVAPVSQQVQYSDHIADVTIVATDVADDLMSATTSWSIDGGGFTDGLPDYLALTDEGCSIADNTNTCTWTLSGITGVPAGDYTVRVTVEDDEGAQTYADITIAVNPEDASVAFEEENPVGEQVAEPSGNSGEFSFTVYVSETEPDHPEGSSEAGDISLVDVSMRLVSVGPGSSPDPTSCSRTVEGTDYDGVLTLICSFNDVPVNTYSVQVTAGGGYYTGYGEDVLVIYDPSLGFATGGGWFYWPGTDERINFGFTMKYNKKGTNMQGNLLLIRHLPDGSIYRVKSNALYGLALGESEEPPMGWASFSGKATYMEPSWLEPEGNHEFLAYVEDHNEPGTGIDRFWIEVKDKDGAFVPVMSMAREATDNAVVLEGGNIVVPHAGGKGRNK